MSKLKLITAYDAQIAFASALKAARESKGYSYIDLAAISNVPADDIANFEETGNIDFAALTRLWFCLDDISRLFDLTGQEIPERTKRNSSDQVIREIIEANKDR